MATPLQAVADLIENKKFQFRYNGKKLELIHYRINEIKEFINNFILMYNDLKKELKIYDILKKTYDAFKDYRTNEIIKIKNTYSDNELDELNSLYELIKICEEKLFY